MPVCVRVLFVQRGDVVRGRVSKVEEYGVFVNLLDLPGVKGLVHRTEISWDPVAINDIRYQRGELVWSVGHTHTYTHVHVHSTHTHARARTGCKLA